MKFDENLTTIHGYLCGDGYVMKNPTTQKHEYYRISFRNTNLTLLRDFQSKFLGLFGLRPYITNEGRSRIQNKEIYEILTPKYSYYSYEWTMPKLPQKYLKFWMRAMFDCEGWVEYNKKKYRRLVRFESCNQRGIMSIQTGLKRFKIESRVSKRINRKFF